MFDSSLYTIGWICALRTELVAAAEHLDEEHDASEHDSAANDNNSYVFGRIGNHHVVIATLPSGEYGTNSAASVARDMVRTFTNIRIGLMVGIGGGAPGPADIRLGDVVVSAPKNGRGGVWQYDYGKTIQGEGFKVTGHLNPPPQCLLTAMNVLGGEFERKGNGLDEAIQDVLARNSRIRKTYQRPDPSTDRLHRALFLHTGSDCSTCIEGLVHREEREEIVVVHEGLVASANQLMKDATVRDSLSGEFGVLCFEMEAAGLMNQFPFLVIRGICDYSDTHKNKSWQGYAAMTAAAYAKKLLLRLSPTKVQAEANLSKVIRNLSEINEGLAEVGRRLRQQTTRAVREDLKNWLAAPNPDPNFQTSLELREPETGTWMVGSDRYQQWKNGTIRHLWLHGKAGCGKSVVTGTIIEDVRKHCGAGMDLGSAMFYFTFSDTNKQSYSDCLRSVTQQIAGEEPVSSELESLYELKKNTIPTSTENLQNFQNILQNGLRCYRQFFLILDALDEVPEMSRNDVRPRGQLMDWIQAMCADIPQLQILVTSRHILDIDEAMNEMGFTPISMATECVNKDIQAYVANQLNSDRRLHRLSEDMKQKVQDVFLEKADGMFRWAYCQMNDLKNLKSTQPSDIERALKNLPTTLDETYDRILASIPPGLQDRALRMLRWLAYAQRPMRLLELSEARIIDLEGHKGQLHTADRGNPEDVLEILSSLIITIPGPQVTPAPYVFQQHIHPKSMKNKTYREYLPAKGIEPIPYSATNIVSSPDDKASVTSLVGSNTVTKVSTTTDDRVVRKKVIGPYYYMRLAHFSIQEYLESRRILTSQMRSFHLDRTRDEQLLAESCAVYLMCYSEQKHGTSVRGDFDTFPLLIYAARNWYRHCQEEGDFSKVLQFLESKSAMSYWTLLHDPDRDRFPAEYSRIEDPAPGIFYAAKFGLNSIVRRLINLGMDVNATSSKYGTLLEVASRGGHISVVKTLIDAGVDVNDGSLAVASWNNNIVAVKVLLKSGANANVFAMHTVPGRPLLVEAATHGRLLLVQTLIEDGRADVNLADEQGRTALMEAAQQDYTDIFEYLLHHKADVNAKSETRRTALIDSVVCGCRDTFKLLIKHGAEVNFASINAGTPLIAASSNGDVESVKTLIEYGADTNISVINAGTALIAAASRNDTEIFKILIENGADINLKGGYYGTALIAATANHSMEIFEMLIESGADVNAQVDEHGTALMVAAKAHDLKLATSLIEHGADIQKRCKVSWFDLAGIGIDHGQSNQVQVVKLLLDHGADVKSSGSNWTALQLACNQKLKSIWNQLVPFQVNGPLTALQMGSVGGDSEVVKMLIAHGAEVNAEGPQGTALELAVKNILIDSVRLLLENGASVGTHGKHGTILEEALRGLPAWDEADVLKPPFYVSTALANVKGRHEIVRLLREYGSQELSAHSSNS